MPMNARYPSLFSPTRVGELELPHRLVMAPLTRMRADAHGTPTAMMAEYYAQRAEAALIVSEGVVIHARGKGFRNTAGIYSSKQVAGWRTVTDSVHDAGGRIVCQLWHVGRQSHPLLLDGRPPVGPSAIASPESSPTPEGDRPHATPHALDIPEIQQIVRQFGHAADCALKAGFDGVEIHGAHGYLLDQFLRDSANHRRDTYGGSIDGRSRLLLEVCDEVARHWPVGRIGVRLSPVTAFGGMSDHDPVALYRHVLAQLNQREIAYVHLSRPREDADHPLEVFAAMSDRPVMATGGFNPQEAEGWLAQGTIDLAGVGRLFIANPDLPTRLQRGAELNDPDPDTFYGGGAKGYIDYPRLGKRKPYP
jgi:N-ethylmaleimide reductase